MFSANELLILAGVQLLLLIILFFVVVFILRKQQHKKKIALLIVLFINYLVIPFFTGSNQQLITDEEMIAHFHKHRHEIEILMNDYLTNPGEWGSFRNASPELKTLQQKASVGDMAYKNNHWHENPYSLETAKKYRADVKARIIDTIHDRSRQDVYISLTLKDVRTRFKGKWAYKELLYIPQIAKVEGKKLLYPIGTIRPERINFRIISDSLDHVPDWLKPWDCTMKRIDNHWFLALCLSA